MGGIIGFILVTLAGFIFGRMSERRHFKSLIKREGELSDILTVSTRSGAAADMTHPNLVSGSVVVANDAFKKLMAGFRIFFGGPIRSYESLMERARREAIVRMKEQAREQGHKVILNVRLETATILGKSGANVGSLEVLAYGTALGAANLASGGLVVPSKTEYQF